MRINQILTESEQEQLQDLYEGPKFNKFGKAVGDVAGMAAKGAGAVAGGVAGAWDAAKKGFRSAKDRVAQGGDSPDAVIDPQKRTRAKAAPMGGTAPAGGGAPVDDPTAGGTAPGSSTTDPAGKKPGFIAGMKQGLSGKKSKPAAPIVGKSLGGAAPGGAAPANQLGASPAVDPAPTSAGDINAAGPKGSAPAKAQTGKAALAMQKSADATAGAGAEKVGQTVYAQVKSQVGQLDKKGKQRIMQLLQKSLAQPAPAAAPAGAPAAPAGKKPGAAPAPAHANIPGAKTAPAANAAPTAPAAEPAAPTAPAAEPAAPASRVNAANGGVQVGTKQSEPGANFDTATGKALPGRALNGVRRKAEVGAGALGKARKGMNARKAPSPSQAEYDADREAKMGVTSDSIIRSHNSLAETLLRAIAEEKSRMVAEGKISIFRNTK
jgi:hypothetical protein